MPIEVISNIVAKNNGNFGATEDIEIKGGYRVVADITERDAIRPGRLKPGCVAHVLSLGEDQRWNGSAWVTIPAVDPGGGSTFTHVVDLKDAGLVLDGVTDDGPALNALLTYYADPSRDGGVTFVKPPQYTQLATSVPIVVGNRNIAFDFGSTSFVARGGTPGKPWAPLEIVWIGAAAPTSAVIDIYPTLGFSPAGMAFRGIHVNCASLAGYGVRVRSARKIDFDIVVEEPRTCGVYLGTKDDAVTTDDLNTQDVTGDFYIHRVNDTYPADGFVFDGVQDPAKSGNGSFNTDIRSIQGTSGAGGDFVKFKASDNNRVLVVRHWQSGARVGNSLNFERSIVFEGTNSSTKPTHARYNEIYWISHKREAGLTVFEGSAKWSYRTAENNRIVRVDQENGTPSPINEPGALGNSFDRTLGTVYTEIHGSGTPKQFNLRVGGAHQIFLDTADAAVLNFEISGRIAQEAFIETFVRVVQDSVGGRTLGTPIVNNGAGTGGTFAWLEGAPTLNKAANGVTLLKFIHTTDPFASAWAPTTVYAVNQRVVRTGTTSPIYTCVQTGTSGAGPDHPFGTPPITDNTPITDGTVIWRNRPITNGRQTYGFKMSGLSPQLPAAIDSGSGSPLAWTLEPDTWTEITLAATGHPVAINTAGLTLGQTAVCFLRVLQDGTGGRTITWSLSGGGTLDWHENSAPTLSPNANDWDYFEFRLRRLADGTRRVVGRRIASKVASGGGAGVTNLSLGTRTATSLDILSDTGTDVTVPAASVTEAGLMSAADKERLASINVHLGSVAEDPGPPAKFIITAGTTAEITLTGTGHTVEVDATDVPAGSHAITRIRVIQGTGGSKTVTTWQASVGGVTHTSQWTGLTPPALSDIENTTDHFEVLTRRAPSTGGAASYWRRTWAHHGDRGSGWDSVFSRILTVGASITLLPGGWNEVTIDSTGHTIVVPTSAVARNAVTTMLKIIQGSGGGKTVTTWTNVDQWAGGVAPVLKTGAGEWDLIQFIDRMNNGGTTRTILGILLAGS